MNENQLAAVVCRAAFNVHRNLGPGLLESAYEACLVYELEQLGLKAERQKSLPLIYNEIQMGTGYRIDIIVEDKLILEIKSVKEVSDLHLTQLVSYLKLSECKLGLLMNFNVELFKSGVRRVVNG